MDSTTFNSIRDDLKNSEKPVPHPYLDIKGSVTTGIGFKTDKFEDFSKLALTNKVTGEPATPVEIKQAWDDMQEVKRAFAETPAKFNLKASTYKDTTNLVMTLPDMDAKLRKEITTRVDRIKRVMGEDAWNRRTDGEKTVAVNLDYANPGGIKSFPKFVDAFKQGDTDGMVRESLFMTDSETGARDNERLIRNRRNLTGEDDATARRELQKQIKEADEKWRLKKQAEKPANEKAPQGAASDSSEQLDESDLIKGGTGDNQIKGGQGNDNLSAERKKLVENLTKQDNPLEEILEKDPADLTEGELREVMGARRNAKTDAEREKLFGIEKAFFEDKFGTGDAKFDFTGKMIDSPPIRPTNKTPVPAQGQ